MGTRLSNVILKIGGPLSVVPNGAPKFTKNQKDDIELITDIVISWWDIDSGTWLGTADEIKESMLDEFSNHRININLEESSISYMIKGRRVDFYCVQSFTEESLLQEVLEN